MHTKNNSSNVAKINTQKSGNAKIKIVYITLIHLPFAYVLQFSGTGYILFVPNCFQETLTVFKPNNSSPRKFSCTATQMNIHSHLHYFILFCGVKKLQGSRTIHSFIQCERNGVFLGVTGSYGSQKLWTFMKKVLKNCNTGFFRFFFFKTNTTYYHQWTQS